MAFGEQIQVQQQLFCGAIFVAPTAMERVLLSLFGPSEIEVAAKFVRNGKVGLLNPPQHLLIELLLECFRWLQNRIGVRVFSLQIVDDFRVFFMAEPGVVVDTTVPMQNVFHGLSARGGRLRNTFF